MAVKLSERVRNAMLDAIEATINAPGVDALLRIRTGPPPANAAAGATGTVLATILLPNDWMAAAAAGVKAMAGAWQDADADAAGTAGWFEIVAHDGARDFQGSVTATGGGGDMTLDNVVLAVGQEFNVTAFSITAPNA